jgi:cytochrome c
MKIVGFLLTAAVPFLAADLATQSAWPQSAQEDIARGKAYAEIHCARCHAIGKSGESPFKPAPPFRTLHERYSVESLEEALGEGIVTGHPAMPEFRLEPRQIEQFIAFLKSLEQ